MIRKILLTVIWWAYALITIIAENKFKKEATKEEEKEQRTIFTILINEYIIGIGIILTIMIWTN